MGKLRKSRRKKKTLVIPSRPRSDRLLADINMAPVLLRGLDEGGHSCLFSLDTALEIAREGGSGIMDYYSPLNLITVSQRSKYHFFSGYGMKLIDTEEVRATQFIPAHLKPIKDMAFGPSHSLLLSVSIDCTATLLDIAGTSNPIAATMTTDSPLWSCCWDACNPNLLYVGSQGGVILTYDIRRTSRPVYRKSDPADCSPIISLLSVPPSPGRSLPLGGLMSCHAANCWVHDHASNEIRRISIEGPLAYLRYEPMTQHFLFSTRATPKHPQTRFVVCERALQRAPTENDWRCGPPAICKPPVQTFLGGSEKKVRSRPCIVPIERDLVVAGYQQSSSTVALWSVGSGNRVFTIPASDTVVDSCSIKVNGETQIVFLTQKVLRFYKYDNS